MNDSIEDTKSTSKAEPEAEEQILNVLADQGIAVCGDLTGRDRRNLNRANGWMLFWLVCFAAVTWLIRAEILTAGPFGWIVALLPTAIGIVALTRFGRFLREADELQRKIQLEALALGLGAGLFAGFGYRLFEGLGAPVADISDASVVIVFFYLIGLWMGRRRYA